MNLWLANLLIKYTECSVIINPLETSLVWTCHGNFLKWVLHAPAGMQIILMEKSILVMVPLDPSRQSHYIVSKQDRQQSSKK